MRRLLTRTLLTIAGGAAAVALAASSASAAGWTIAGSPDPSPVTGTSTDTQLIVHDPGGNQTLTCTSSTATAQVPNGTVAGPKVGDITNLTFSNCTLAGFIPFTVATSGFNYALNAISQPGGPGTDVNGTITGGIHAAISSNVGCSTTVSGSSVDVIYHNDIFQLQVPGTNQDLVLSGTNVAGCQNLLHDGDTAQFTGHYDLDSAVTINES